MKKLLNRIWRFAEKALRIILTTIFAIFAAVIILVLCIAAIITTIGEKFFALLSSIIAIALAAVGRYLLGIK